MIINTKNSLFIREFNEWDYVDVTLHKFFIDKDKCRMLISILPKNMQLFNELNDFDVVIRHADCGRYDDWNNGKIVLDVSNCTVKQKWFDYFVTSNPDDTNIVALYCYVTGQIEFIDWKLLDERN